MSYLTDKAKEQISEMFIHDLEEYAQTRKNSVKENRETPELAALLIEKYGYGLASASKFLELHTQVIYDTIDKLVESIDRKARATRERRWNARPAGLSFDKEPATKIESSPMT